MAEKNLTENLNFVNQNKDTLLQEYENKYIVVYGGNIIGSYDTYESAVEETIKRIGADKDFLVHHLMQNEPINFVIGAIS